MGFHQARFHASPPTLSRTYHEGTLNRRTSLAEITGGREEGSFSIKGEERLSARLLNRHCQIPPPSALQTLLVQPRVKNTLTWASGHSATLCDTVIFPRGKK